MTSSTDRQTTPGRPKGPLIALVIAAAGIAAALYGMHHGRGNGADAACAAAAPVATRMAPLAKGDVAAVSVPKRPELLKDLHFTGPDGKPAKLSDFRGKTILLNLWATWCVPCRLEMPALDALQQKLGSDDFAVVAVNIDTSNPEQPHRWLQQNKITHLAYYSDKTALIFQELKSVGKAFGMPTSLIVGKQGCELGYIAGPAEWDHPDALALIKAALGPS